VWIFELLLKLFAILSAATLPASETLGRTFLEEIMQNRATRYTITKSRNHAEAVSKKLAALLVLSEAGRGGGWRESQWRFGRSPMIDAKTMAKSIGELP
jgi:hypothetical protein